jgi:competence protein ComEC
MKRLLVFQVLILFICAVVYTPAISAEKVEKEHETIGIQKYQSSELNPNVEKKKNEDPIVYITKTGKKYHKDGCSYLRYSKIRIRLSEAKRKGYTPCSKCKPPK